MSVMAETSQLAMGPYVAMAAVGLVLYAWTALCRESLVVKVAACSDGGGGLGDGGLGGDGGGGGLLGGGGGGDGGGGDGDGGGGEGSGEGGSGGGDWNCTSKDSVPGPPNFKEKLCPKPGAAHSFPSQKPAPSESVISRVHVAPSATANGALEV